MAGCSRTETAQARGREAAAKAVKTEPVRDPMNVHVETFGTGKIPHEKIVGIVRRYFNLTPGGIIEKLELRRPLYRQTAAYGHFGRNDPDFTWEATDKAAQLASDAGLREPVGAGVRK